MFFMLKQDISDVKGFSIIQPDNNDFQPVVQAVQHCCLLCLSSAKQLTFGISLEAPHPQDVRPVFGSSERLH